MTYREQKIRDLIDETDIAWNMLLNYLEISKYFLVFNLMDEKEKRFYNNKLCSDLAIICEKYSKALYLRTATIPDGIINRLNLNDENIVNLIVGSDDTKTTTIYGQLTKEEKKQLQELKFQGISHNFTKLYNDDNMNLKHIKAFFTYAMKDLEYADDTKLEDLLYSDKVYDAFVKGRYSSLNNYDADFSALIMLCEILQKEILKGEKSFRYECVEIIAEGKIDLALDFYNYKKCLENHTNLFGGNQPRFRTIKHVYPSLNSKIIIEKNGNKKEYCFGEHKLASLYKSVTLNGINQIVKKSEEELLNDIEEAPVGIGLYSVNEGADKVVELNKVSNPAAIAIENGDIVTFEDSNGLHFVTNIGGQLISANDNLIKLNVDAKNQII